MKVSYSISLLLLLPVLCVSGVCATSETRSTSTHWFTTYYVSALGSDTNTGTSTSAPLLTMSAALSKASSGDTVSVMPGQYRGSLNVGLVIESDIRIQAYNGDARPIFRGDQDIVWRFVCGSSSVSGIDIVGADTALLLEGGKLSVEKININDTATAVAMSSTNATSLSVTASTFLGCASNCLNMCSSSGSSAQSSIKPCSGSQVTLSDLLVSSGSNGNLGNLVLGSGVTVNAQNCTFGAFTGLSSSTSSISHSVSNLNGDLRMSDCIVENAYGYNTGAGIYQSGSQARTSLVNCLIRNNQLSGISSNYLYGAGAYCSSGAFLVQNSNFTGNSVGYASYAGYGGAIYSGSSCSCSVFSTTFLDNSVYQGQGGALGCAAKGTIAWYDCTFTDNTPEGAYNCK